jgi:hypothetical protein
MTFGNDSVEFRDGKPFCKQCGQPVSTVTVDEPGVFPSQQSGKAYFCSTHGQTIVIDGINSPAQI